MTVIRNAEQRVRDFLLAEPELNAAVGGRLAVGELRAGVAMPAILVQATEVGAEQSLKDASVVNRVAVMIAVWAQGRTPALDVCDKMLRCITSEAAPEAGIWFQPGARALQLEEHESDLYNCTATVEVWL